MLKLSTAPHCQERKLLCQFFTQVIHLLEKTKQWNLKFWSSCLLEENSLNIFMLKWEPGFRFWWNFPQLSTVRTGNCCVIFLLSQFIFYTKPTNEIWNFDLLTCSKKIHPNFLCWIGNQGLDFGETLHSFLLSRKETVASIFCSGNLSFRENQPIKFEILIFLPARRKFTQFFYAELGTRV